MLTERVSDCKKLFDRIFRTTNGLRNSVYISVATVTMISVVCMLVSKHPESIGTLLIASLAVVFSFHSYIAASEKLRLDLFEKRWPIYEKTVEFCSLNMQNGLKYDESNPEAFKRLIEASQQSFRGLGYHKTKALFGEDVNKLADEMGNAYAWLISFIDQPTEHRNKDWSKNMYDYNMLIVNAVGELPRLMRPYIYFGHIQNKYL